MEYYSAIQNNEILPIVLTLMGEDNIILSEVKQRKTDITWYHSMWNLKSNINEVIYGNRLTDIENKLMLTKGERSRRDKLGVWD